MKKLPKFDPVEASTFSPYDINDVDSDLVISERNAVAETYNTRFYTALGIGLAGAITVMILLFFCYKMSEQNRTDQTVIPKNQSELHFNNSNTTISKIAEAVENEYNHRELTTRHVF